MVRARHRQVLVQWWRMPVARICFGRGRHELFPAKGECIPVDVHEQMDCESDDNVFPLEL